MAKRLFGILVCLFLQLARTLAISWQGASSTTRNRHSSTTKASLATRAVSLTSRAHQLETPSTYEPAHVCGYVDYNQYNSYTCAGSNTCLWNSHLKLVGCGNPTTSIIYITECIPYHALQYCDTTCFSNPSIIKCGSAVPHCLTARIGPNSSYSLLDCQSISPHTHFNVHLHYSNQTSIGHLPRYLGDDGNITYATHVPHLSLNSYTDSSSDVVITKTSAENLNGGHRSKMKTEVIITSTVFVETGTENDGAEELGNENDSGDGKRILRYEQEQKEKEIVAGSVIGAFMVLVILIFGIGVWIAWKRKLAREKVGGGKGNGEEGSELTVVADRRAAG